LQLTIKCLAVAVCELAKCITRLRGDLDGSSFWHTKQYANSGSLAASNPEIGQCIR